MTAFGKKQYIPTEDGGIAYTPYSAFMGEPHIPAIDTYGLLEWHGRQGTTCGMVATPERVRALFERADPKQAPELIGKALLLIESTDDRPFLTQKRD